VNRLNPAWPGSLRPPCLTLLPNQRHDRNQHLSRNRHHSRRRTRPGREATKSLAWLGLVSYSVYLLHPALIEVYASVPWTQNENFVPMELLMTGVFVLVLLVSCALAHRFIEAPMQRQGRLMARWLDARFGPDTPSRRHDRPGELAGAGGSASPS
jgi:peptidoglycan/LPS O-acetylase OafA/YrhL